MRERRKSITGILLFLTFILIVLIPGSKAYASDYEYDDENCKFIGDGWEFDFSDMSQVKVTISTQDGLEDWCHTKVNDPTFKPAIEDFATFPLPVKTIEIASDTISPSSLDGRVGMGLTSLTDIVYPSTGNWEGKYVTVDGVVYSANGKKVVFYPEGRCSETVTLPDAVEIIGNFAFRKNTTIKKVIANNLQYIDTWVFTKSSIEEFECNKINSFGMDAFGYADKLKTITIKSNGDKEVLIQPSAFEDCSSLIEFPYKATVMNGAFSNCSSLTGFTLSETATKIEVMTFFHCSSISEFNVPASVTYLGGSVFEGCTSLKKLTFNSATPPEIEADSLRGCPTDMQIIVPAGSEETYIAAFLEATGEDYTDNIYFNRIKYALYVNGEQFNSDNLTISCGDGTATFDPETNTLTLTDAEITKGVDKYAYGGCINTGIKDLTIVINGNNKIENESFTGTWDDIDGISNGEGCSITLKGSGTLSISKVASAAYIGLGSWPDTEEGDFTIDGPTLITDKGISVNRNFTVKGGGVLSSTASIRSNAAGTVLVDEGGSLTASFINMGLPVDANSPEKDKKDMKVILENGELILSSGISFADQDPDNDDPRGYIELNDGTIVIKDKAGEGKKIADCPPEQITIAPGFNLTVEEFLKGEINASSGHTWGEWTKLDDEYHQRTCPGDGTDAHPSHVETKAHKWDGGNVTKEATVDEEGEKTFTCTVCGATKIEKIDKLPASATPTPEATPTGTPSDKPASTPTPTTPVTSPTSDPGTQPTPTPDGGETPAATPSPDPTTQMGEDGTAVGKGASFEAADKLITSMTSDDDPAGSVYHVLQAKVAKVTKNSVKISWKKPAGAVKFVVYGNKCGKGIKPVKLEEVTGTNFTLKKLEGKALKKGTYYKFLIVSLDKDNKVISTSKVVHAATLGGKVGNVKKITSKAKKNKVSLKVKKTFKLKAKQVAKSKKLKVKKHRALKYETTDTAIATVSAKGVIKAVGKGKCEVYVYSQDGICQKIKVTVK